MAQSAVLEALGNDLILERIFHPFDFKRLKELRLVCKCWNTFACRQLVRRCKNVQLRKPEQWRVYENSIEARRPFTRPGFEEVVEIEPLVCNHWNWIFFGKLCDCSASSKVRTSFRRKAQKETQPAQLASSEIFLKIPLEVEIHSEYNVGLGKKNSFPFRLVEAKWRSQVVSLTIGLWFTVAEVNSLTLFLLHHLTGLKKLEFCYIENQSAPRKTDEDECKVPVLEMAQDTTFGLEYLQYEILEGGFQAYVLDPGFLRHCPELKTFKIKCWAHSNPNMGNNICLNFFNRWNQIVLSEPDVFPKIRHLKFEIRNEFGTKTENYHAHFCNSISNLISLNEPTRLELLGNFDYNFPNLFSKIPCWTRGIHALTMDIPGFIKIDKSRCDEFFRLLNVPKFPQLTRVSLKPFAVQNKFPLVYIKDQLQLATVTAVSLRLPIKDGSLCSSRFLRQAATQFPSLTHLNLKLPAEDEYLKLNTSSLDLLFESCKQFTALRLLSLEGYLHTGQRSYDPTFQGRFKSLQVLENLETFKLIVEIWEAQVQDVLVFLFQGYQPHVSLDLEIRTRKGLEAIKCKNLKLSVEGFKEALNKACRSKRRLQH